MRLYFFLFTICCIALPLRAQDKGIADYPKLSAEHDWPWWRGPSRNGIAYDKQSPPTKWSEKESVLWRVPIPGRGHSSPILVGKQVILATADEKGQIHSVLSLDRANGKELWQREINRGGFPERNHAKNTEATTTLACDGERLFVTFFHHKKVVATALDLTGKPLWVETVGPFDPKKYEYGYAPSPVLYRDTMIVAAEYDGESAITALDRKTGKQVWRKPRPNNTSFSSPVVAHVAGRDQLLISGADLVASYDPANGKELWKTAGTTAATCGTIVWDGDLIFASGGYPKSETLGARADGKGEVLWTNRQNCYEQSMLAHNGYLYALTGKGIVFCWRGEDGKEMWTKRLKGPVSASPVLAGGHIYWANELGTMYVFKADPEKLTLVAENQLDEESFASPAICDGRIFLRTAKQVNGKRQEFVTCIGK